MSLKVAGVFFLLVISVQESDSRFTKISDVQFCTGGGKRLLMDVFKPTHPIRTPAPAVLWIHGGGWLTGDKRDNLGAVLIAGEGYVTASLSYRLSGDSPFPANIEDCKCAIRFLRANAARFGIDPDRIGVAGSSSGGHLAELVATAGDQAGLEGDGGWPGVSSKVKAAAAFYGASDFTVGETQFERHTGKAVIKLFRGTQKEKPELYQMASPIFYVSKESPPLLLAHGEKDELVPIDQSLRMAEAYRQAGAPVEMITVRNAGHDFEPAGNGPISPGVEELHQLTYAFFRRHLAEIPADSPKH